MSPHRNGPLAGIVVVDVTTTMLGPFCSLRLAELGADVIKIEAPGGDVTRQASKEPAFSGSFLTTNAGKRSVVLDLKHDAGKRAVHHLASRADVFLHNMPSPTARRLGIDEPAVRASAPTIVYCAAYGFGDTGPYAGRPAYDDVIQAASGLTSTQHASVERPAYVSSPVVDKTVGLMAALSIAAALVHRTRTGEGIAIEVPMFEVMTSYVLQETLGDSAFVPPHGPPGSRIASSYRRPYRTSDGFLSLLLITDEQWRRFLTIAGRPELIDDHRFRSVSSRGVFKAEVFGMLDEILSTRSSAEWLELLLAHRLPVGPVNTLEEVLDDEHLAAVGFWEQFDDAVVGTVRRPRSGVTFSTGRVDLGAPPRLGEHTEEVLRQFDVDEGTVAEVVGTHGAEAS